MAPDTNYPDRDPRDETIATLRQQLAAAEGELDRLREWADGPNGVRWYMAKTEEAIAERDRESARLDWLETQCMAYGFESQVEGYSWEVRGPYVTARDAIDAAIAAAAGDAGGRDGR